MSLGCALQGQPQEWPDTGEAGLWCCYGSAEYGPYRCTCWTPVYDVVQQRPRIDVLSSAMPRMCGTCAFRPNSPERSGDPKAAADWDDLQRLVATGSPFWCHDGLRAPVAYVHPPSGTWYIVEDDLAFHPPIRRDKHDTATPYRADGRPGDLCAGWLALTLARDHRPAAPTPTWEPPTDRTRVLSLPPATLAPRDGKERTDASV